MYLYVTQTIDALKILLNLPLSLKLHIHSVAEFLQTMLDYFREVAFMRQPMTPPPRQSLTV